jgi:hypothetical protein
MNATNNNLPKLSLVEKSGLSHMHLLQHERKELRF